MKYFADLLELLVQHKSLQLLSKQDIGCKGAISLPRIDSMLLDDVG